MDKAEAIERLGYQKARAQIALEQEVPEWIAEDLLGTIEAYDMAIEALQTEPKRGAWKRRIVDNGFNADWVCSECGYRVKTDFVDYNFCPNCGARMKGADDDRDNI